MESDKRRRNESVRKSSRLREKERVSYLDPFENGDEEDDNLTKDEVAAISADLPPFDLSNLEKELFPEVIDTPDLFIQIRNHILEKWQDNIFEHLTIPNATKGLQEKYASLVKPIYHYLQRYGLINTGVLSILNLEKVPKKIRVIVVGAGMAGLAVSRQLHSFGYDVIVLEARDRVGGRVKTDWSLGGGVDMGASIITGLEGNPLTNLCKQLDISLHRLNYDCPIYDIDGQSLPEEVDTKVEQIFNRILETSSEKKNDLPTSLGEALMKLLQDIPLTDAERRVFHWHLANLEYGVACELSSVSLQHWDQDDEYEWSGDHCLITTGYSSIAEKLASGIDIRLNTIVRKIEYNTSGVRISTDNEDFDSDFAVVTLPLGVLKAGTVVFNPPLPPSKSSSIQRLGFGLLNKIALLFPTVFWDDNLDYFGQVNESLEYRGEFYLFWNLHRCMHKPVLVTLLAGTAAHLAESTPEEELVKRVMVTLRKQFGSIPDPIKYVVTHWASDEFARGTYSYISVNASGKDYDVLAEPVSNVLFFAGEATTHEHPATAAGAYYSGLRCAGQLDEQHEGKIKLGPEYERLVVEYKLNSQSPSKSSRRSHWQHDRKETTFSRGKKRMRVKKSKINEEYSWLFTTTYRIPKKMKTEETNGESTTENFVTRSSNYYDPQLYQQRLNDLNPGARRVIRQNSFTCVNKIVQPATSSNSRSSTSQQPEQPKQQQQIAPKLHSKPYQTSPSFKYEKPSPPISNHTKAMPPNFEATNHFYNYQINFPKNQTSPFTFSSIQQTVSLQNLQNNNRRTLEVQENGSSDKTLNNVHVTPEFKAEVSSIVQKSLTKYYPDVSSVLSKEDYKHLARKLTHLCIQKEKKHNSNSVLTLTPEVEKKITKFVKNFIVLITKDKP